MGQNRGSKPPIIAAAASGPGDYVAGGLEAAAGGVNAGISTPTTLRDIARASFPIQCRAVSLRDGVGKQHPRSGRRPLVPVAVTL